MTTAMGTERKSDHSSPIRDRCLELAVTYHGLANHADGAIPANPETVIATSELFASYLSAGTVPPPRPGKHTR